MGNHRDGSLGLHAVAFIIIEREIHGIPFLDRNQVIFVDADLNLQGIHGIDRQQRIPFADRLAGCSVHRGDDAADI